MVEYLKTKKGYFYKLSKKGQKKRLSKTKFSKKLQKTIKNKKMIGGDGGPILPSDIMYQDDLVCILYPHVKKGILVFTRYKQPPGMKSLCELGLKTGRQLQAEGVHFGRSVYHPYSFFRAPYYAGHIDYSTIETEVISSFGTRLDYRNIMFIRVDPDRTSVFSSEIRPKLMGQRQYEQFLLNSKKTLSDYLRIIYNNMLIEQQIPPGKRPWWNLFDSRVSLFPIYVESVNFPFDSSPINLNSEILVQIPHLTPDYFVYCT
jgi:hypothetical protein